MLNEFTVLAEDRHLVEPVAGQIRENHRCNRCIGGNSRAPGRRNGDSLLGRERELAVASGKEDHLPPAGDRHVHEASLVDEPQPDRLCRFRNVKDLGIASQGTTWPFEHEHGGSAPTGHADNKVLETVATVDVASGECRHWAGERYRHLGLDRTLAVTGEQGETVFTDGGSDDVLVAVTVEVANSQVLGSQRHGHDQGRPVER
jgi:hypothetical protein